MQGLGFNYVFGPVKSSRLGISLGVDLLGKKICSFDCLYCEVGKTVHKTIQRSTYVDPDQILNELERWFAHLHIKPEVITFGGKGEPTLHAELGFLAREVKKRLAYPLALLTNSSLLREEQVLDELEYFDFILPSLDTVIEKEFLRLNRPVQGLSVEQIKQGLLKLKKIFRGKVYLEILLVPQINTSWQNKAGLKEFVDKLNPDRVDVVTITRPGAYVKQGVEDLVLKEWQKALAKISRFKVTDRQIWLDLAPSQVRELVFNSLQRRPQTIKGLSLGLGIRKEQIQQAIQDLKDTQVLAEICPEQGEVYYKIRE